MRLPFEIMMNIVSYCDTNVQLVFRLTCVLFAKMIGIVINDNMEMMINIIHDKVNIKRFYSFHHGINVNDVRHAYYYLLEHHKLSMIPIKFELVWVKRDGEYHYTAHNISYDDDNMVCDGVKIGKGHTCIINEYDIYCGKDCIVTIRSCYNNPLKKVKGTLVDKLGYSSPYLLVYNKNVDKIKLYVVVDGFGKERDVVHYDVVICDKLF